MLNKSEFIGIRVTPELKQAVCIKSRGKITAYVLGLIDRDLKGNRFLKVFSRR